MSVLQDPRGVGWGRAGGVVLSHPSLTLFLRHPFSQSYVLAALIPALLLDVLSFLLGCHLLTQGVKAGL